VPFPRRFSLPVLSARPGLAAVLAAVLAAGGCTSRLADLAEPAGTPGRSAAPAWPAVNAVPVQRDTKPLTDAERQRVTDELAASRDHHEADRTAEIAGKGPTPGATAGSVKAAGVAIAPQSTTR